MCVINSGEWCIFSAHMKASRWPCLLNVYLISSLVVPILSVWHFFDERQIMPHPVVAQPGHPQFTQGAQAWESEQLNLIAPFLFLRRGTFISHTVGAMFRACRKNVYLNIMNIFTLFSCSRCSKEAAGDNTFLPAAAGACCRFQVKLP